MSTPLRLIGSFLMGAALMGIGTWGGNVPLMLIAVVLFSVGLAVWHEGQP